jgi:hypothetical protein
MCSSSPEKVALIDELTGRVRVVCIPCGFFLYAVYDMPIGFAVRLYFSVVMFDVLFLCYRALGTGINRTTSNFADPSEDTDDLKEKAMDKLIEDEELEEGKVRSL